MFSALKSVRMSSFWHIEFNVYGICMADFPSSSPSFCSTRVAASCSCVRSTIRAPAIRCALRFRNTAKSKRVRLSPLCLFLLSLVCVCFLIMTLFDPIHLTLAFVSHLVLHPPSRAQPPSSLTRICSAPKAMVSSRLRAPRRPKSRCRVRSKKSTVVSPRCLPFFTLPTW